MIITSLFKGFTQNIITPVHETETAQRRKYLRRLNANRNETFSAFKREFQQ